MVCRSCDIKHSFYFRNFLYFLYRKEKLGGCKKGFHESGVVGEEIKREASHSGLVHLS